MAQVPEKVRNVVIDYLGKISTQIPVRKAILFGSYAKGTFDEGSDIDLAIFSEHFEGTSRVESITYLLINAMDYDIDLEPVAFTGKEYDERLGIVDEIIKTGIEIQI